MDDIFEEYPELLNDEKSIAVRQRNQSLGRIAANKPGLRRVIASPADRFKF
jgi:hypothetical protein